MENGDFPQKIESKDKTYLSNISLEHLNQIVEISQVGYRDAGSLWAHTDVLSRPKLEDKVGWFFVMGKQRYLDPS